MAHSRGRSVVEIWQRMVSIIAHSSGHRLVIFTGASGLRSRILHKMWWSVYDSFRTFIGVATDKQISSSSGTERAR